MEKSTPSEFVARLYEKAEAQAARAGERLVGSSGFATLLGQLAENVAALSKLSNDAIDLAWRNLRVAGRRDIVRLARQLARTEDKLERVLQEVEALRDALDDADSTAATRPDRHHARNAAAKVPAASGARAGARNTAAAHGAGQPHTVPPDGPAKVE